MNTDTYTANRVSYVEKYRPKKLSELLGQQWVSQCLSEYLEQPHSVALILAGGTGTGKTTAAVLLAEELGVAVGEAEFGGLYSIASGEQTGESVRRTMDSLHTRPFFGSGWRVLIVNEADVMTPGAAHVWLDALENLPKKCVVVFTTNALCRLPRRLRDRCETLHFESGALILLPELRRFAEAVWLAETGQPLPVPLEAFGPMADEEGNASFRRLLQTMTPYLRAKKPPVWEAEEEREVKPLSPGRAAALKAWATRRARAAQMAVAL